jgi:hypothetical protein
MEERAWMWLNDQLATSKKPEQAIKKTSTGLLEGGFGNICGDAEASGSLKGQSTRRS